jgi:phosphotriesterase-related protein
MTILYTTLGPKTLSELGLMLPHEHIFVDFRPPEHPNHGEADAADVVALMAPELKKIQAQGVTALKA